MKEVEVEWQNRDESDTKDQAGQLSRYFKESIEMAKEIIRVEFNRIKGLYNCQPTDYPAD
ncbi:MAG: hypothetical protein JXA14_03515 [Anaerolineae bacterium]|nr:hypothetical protein [Anaerolineae bacterium]